MTTTPTKSRTDPPDSTFLDDLERELLAAHPRRARAKRRAAAERALRSAPALVVLLVILSAAGAFLVSVGRDDAPPQRSARTAPGDRSATIDSHPGRGEAVPPAAPLPGGAAPPSGVRIAILNGTKLPGLGKGARDFFGVIHHVATVTDAARSDISRTTVRYTPGHESDARGVAGMIGVPTAPLTADQRAIAGQDVDVAVVLGADAHRTGSFPLQEAGGWKDHGSLKLLGVGDATSFSLSAAVDTKSRRVAAWLVRSDDQRATFLGFIPRDPRQRRLAVAARLPRNPGPDRRFVLSVEPDDDVGELPARPILETPVAITG